MMIEGEGPSDATGVEHGERDRITKGPVWSAVVEFGDLIHRGVKMPARRLLVVIALLSIGVSTGAHAQWLNYPTPGTPRTSAGKPNLAAPTPRTAEGKPDLSGVWMHEITSVAEMKRLFEMFCNENEKDGAHMGKK
jgi:hypothetical protein